MRNLLDQASQFCYNETSSKRAIFLLNLTSRKILSVQESREAKVQELNSHQFVGWLDCKVQSTRRPFVLPSKAGRGCYAGEQSSRCSPLLMWVPRWRTTERNRWRNRVSSSLAVGGVWLEGPKISI